MTLKFADTHRKSIQILLASSAMLTLAACGGGGSSGGAGGGGGTGASADDFRTPEFQASTGLEQINAAEGFAQVVGAQGGEGVVIAVLDDGIDEDHPDILPNLIESITFQGSQDVDGPHGTAVAGIAAGDDNGTGTQGVAFNASLVAVQVGDVSADDPTEIDLDLNLAANALSLLASGDIDGDIVNMSFGIPLSGLIRLNDGTIVDLAEADPNLVEANEILEGLMQDVADSGKLMVVAAGNERGIIPALEDAAGLPPGSITNLGPDSPARLAAGVGDGAIVAIAVDENNELAEFSNDCLGVENRCLAAPGVDFNGALVGGGTGGIGSGTSYSAPLIAGSAAVVQAAFGVTPQEAGNRLLSTATDLGAAGTDSTFGRGLLNLENALSPQGQLTVSLSTSSDGPKVALSESTLSLGSSLALDGAGSELLGKAISLDDDNFPFGVDLGRSAAVQSRTTGLEAFIGSSSRKTTAVTAEKVSYNLSLAEDEELDDPYRAEFAPSETSLREEADLPRMQMQSEVQDGVDVFVGFNGSSNTNAGLVQSLPETGDFFQPTAFLAPFDQLSGEQTGGGTTVDLGDNTDLTISAFTSADDDATRQTTMQKIELAHKTVGDIEFRLGYGFMQEDGGFLGSETKGAFGVESGGNSQFLDLSVLAPVTETVSLFGAYSRGNTDASGGTNSLLSNYSTIQSEAFGAGLVMTDVAEKGDGLSVMVGQPLRVTDGSADLTLATGRDVNGTLDQESATLDLAPDGREIAVEAVYNFALDDEDQALTAGSFVRFNPDHDTEADPDLGIGLTYKLSF